MLNWSTKKPQVVLFFATNRLYRKTHRSLRFVEEEVVEQGIRAVFISQGLDTANTEHWRMMLNLHAMIDEHTGSMYGKNIIAALIGLVKIGVVGSSEAFIGARKPGVRLLVTDRDLGRRRGPVGPRAPTGRDARPRELRDVHSARAGVLRAVAIRSRGVAEA